ncbi:MAG: orotidine-5'-phosphate decarboxylase [Planctomycetota bacterium]
MQSFVAELADRVLAGAAPIVIGLDPRLSAFPQGLLPGAAPAARIVAFYRECLPVIAKHAPAVKPNIAFFEAYGSDGYRAYEEVCRQAHEEGLLIVGDVKRGDIGSTAEAYAEGHFRIADSLTLHPYLGHDSIAPFLKWCAPESGGRAVFVLVRTSNPGAKDFQDLPVGTSEVTFCDSVASAVQQWGDGLPQAHGYHAVGAVVGATWPEELARLRRAMPNSWLLLPGVGAQGGKIEDLAAAFDERGLGALVNQSRGVMQCFSPSNDDWLMRIEQACATFARECRAVALQSSPKSSS